MGAKMVLSRLNGPAQIASVAIDYSSVIIAHSDSVAARFLSRAARGGEIALVLAAHHSGCMTNE